MAATHLEYQKILCDRQIDLLKLRAISRHGIPHQVRARAWSHLLEFGPRTFLLTKVMETQPLQLHDNRIRNEISRFFRSRRSQIDPQCSTPESESKLLRAIELYLQIRPSESYSPGLVALGCPLICVMHDEKDIALGLEKICLLTGPSY